ncbi:MAG: AsmA family protein, partial [Gemmatimonadetes bacterium]|nr:AsmA family protein [Gemmatimonadota bacterium]
MTRRGGRDPQVHAVDLECFEDELVAQQGKESDLEPEPARLGGADLRFEALIRNPADRVRDLGFSIAPLGSIDLEGRLLEQDGRLAVEALEARSRDDGPLELAVSGRIGDLARLGDLDLRVDMATPDARLFSDLAGIPLPQAAGRTKLHLHHVDRRLAIEGEAELGVADAFMARASGRIDDALVTPAFDLLLDLESKDVEGLTDALGLQDRLPKAALGPVRASGRVATQNDRLGLEAISVKVGDPTGDHAEIEGVVGDLAGPHGIALRTRIVSDDLQRLAARFDRVLPPVGPADVRFVLTDSDGALGLEDVDLTLGRPGDIFVTTRGQIDDLRALAEIDVETTVFLRDLSTMSETFETDLPDLGPFDYRARVSGSLRDLQSSGSLRVKDTLFEGEFDRVAPTGRRPRVELRVHSPLVTLNDLITPAPVGTYQPLRERLESQFDLVAWWRGNGRLPLDGLRAFDAQVSLRADRLVGTDLLQVDDLVLSAHLDNGRLAVDEAIAKYESGGISARLEVDTRDTRPRFSTAIEAFNVDVTRLLAQFREEVERAGQLDLSVELSTTGATAHDFRSNLDGRFGAMLRKGNLVGDYARKFAFNTLRVSVPRLNFGGGEEAAVQCLLVLFPIEAGMAEVDTFYLEGRQVTVTGTGRMDIVRNAYDLLLEPELHEPGLVSVAATVQVVGPLDNPVFQPLAGSMLLSAV